jgi:hypothetical protein
MAGPSSSIDPDNIQTQPRRPGSTASAARNARNARNNSPIFPAAHSTSSQESDDESDTTQTPRDRNSNPQPPTNIDQLSALVIHIDQIFAQ